MGNNSLVEDENRIVFSDMDTPIFFSGYITQRQFTSMLTALLDGARMRDPDVWQEYTQVFIEWFEQPVDICEIVADCVQNNQSVRNAISDMITSSGSASSPNGAQTVIGNDNTLYSDKNVLTSTSCVDVVVMGECVAIVEELNLIAIDWLEKFSGASLAGELVLVAIETVPLIGHLTPSDLGIMVDWVTDEFLTQYQSAYDTNLRNSAACLLYDLSCNSCVLSIDNMISAFSTETSIGLDPLSTWTELIKDIANLSLSDQIVYGAWLTILVTWKAGNTFLGLNNTATLTYAAQQAVPINPSIIGCEPCQEQPCELYDWSTGLQGWGNIQGGYSSNGYVRCGTSVSNTRTELRIESPIISPAITVSRIEIDSFVIGNIGASPTVTIRDINGTLLYTQVLPTSGSFVISANLSSHDIGQIVVIIFAGFNLGDPNLNTIASTDVRYYCD